MKIIVSVFFALLISTIVCGQTPERFNYQGVARNATGSPLATLSISLRLTIHDGSDTGTIVYQEIQHAITNIFGLYTVAVGGGTVISGTFSAINWGVGSKYMQVEIDPAGGSAFTSLGSSQLLSVPYALFSGNNMPGGTVGNILYHDGTGWVQLPPGANGQVLTMTSGLPVWQHTLPILTTNPIIGVDVTTAGGGGYVISSGTLPVTARGTCWSTSPAPTIAGAHTTDGAGIGSYASNISGLVAATTYYARAYATTAAGTVYGSEVTFTTMPAIGSVYGGGKLAYILQPGDPGFDPAVPHGIIAAPFDQGAAIEWYNGTYTFCAAAPKTIGSGFVNTANIIDAQDVGTYAATICRSLSLGGYNDWFLPSIDELAKLYLNRTAIGGFTTGNYWSSTEYNYMFAWYFIFASGTPNYCNKIIIGPVRAVRSF